MYSMGVFVVHGMFVVDAYCCAWRVVVTGVLGILIGCLFGNPMAIGDRSQLLDVQFVSDHA